MKKAKQAKSQNGSVFKTIVRGVVKEELMPIKEELEKAEKRLERKLEGVEMRLDEKIDKTFRQYRDDVLTGLDPLMGEIKAVREEQAAHSFNHEDINDRLDTLDSIHPNGQHQK